MLSVNPIGSRNIYFIPSIIPGLVATNQQNRCAQWIEGIEDTKRLSPTLNAKLSHFGICRALYLRAMREFQSRPEFPQQQHGSADLNLLCLCQAFPPLVELVGVFYFPPTFPL